MSDFCAPAVIFQTSGELGRVREAEEDGLRRVVVGEEKERETGKKKTLVRRGRESALEKLTQRQTHRLCQEPFRIRGSANTLSDGGAPTSSVFEVRLGFLDSQPTHLPPSLPLRKKKQKRCSFVVSLCGFKKNGAGLSVFPSLCQVFCAPPSRAPKTDFSGSALMRPSHRFHGDSHKTVRFPRLKKKRKKKNLQWGCSPTVRDAASKSVVISFRR